MTVLQVGEQNLAHKQFLIPMQISSVLSSLQNSGCVCTTCSNCNIRDTCVMATACVDMLLVTHSRYDYFHKHHQCVGFGAVYAFRLLHTKNKVLNLEKSELQSI
jgi:hypothetical protein